VARARNRQGEVISYGRSGEPLQRRSLLPWIAIAIVIAIAVLAARADAAPVPCDDELGCETEEVEVPHAVAPCDCPLRVPISASEVAAVAVRVAGLDHDPTPSWNKRARLAGLVPTVSARVGRNLTWKEVDDPTLGYTNMFDIRASWSLERLMFDPNEIRIAAMDVSRRRERRRVEMLAIHTYYAWLGTARGTSVASELEADLDAITDGWFSETLAKAK
jgi:hypothetical protein